MSLKGQLPILPTYFRLQTIDLSPIPLFLRQTLLTPPSTTMSEPVMNELSSEARKRAAAASSSGCASLSMGVYAV